MNNTHLWRLRFPDAAVMRRCAALRPQTRVWWPRRLLAALCPQVLTPALRLQLEGLGVSVRPDLRLRPHSAGAGRFVPTEPARASLEEVLDALQVRPLWGRGYAGQGVELAVVDTGVLGRRPEFPQARRQGGWAPAGADPWMDEVGHGTMCACVAAASREQPGALFEGVAPAARLWSMRTGFYDAELTVIFDRLAQRAATPGVRLVVNCSFGPYTAQPPQVHPEHTFEEALRGAVDAGALVFFSAGDNHRLLGGDNEASGPNSIWRYKSWRDVFVVGACDLEGQMQFYSSRGPGQWFGQPEASAKPDLVAYAPDDLQMLRGDRLSYHRLGWGTSGACPQAAGAAAVLWSARPQAPREALFEALRQGARPLGAAPEACGAGALDVAGALAALEHLSR